MFSFNPLPCPAHPWPLKAGLRGEVSRWRADRDDWLHSMRTMRQEVNDKLLQVRALQKHEGSR